MAAAAAAAPPADAKAAVVPVPTFFRDPKTVELLTKAFPHIDGLLASYTLVDHNHPLAEYLYEATQMVRETLACYELGRLNDPAVESITERLARLNRMHSAFTGPRAEVKLTGELERDGSLGWSARTLQVRQQELYVVSKGRNPLEAQPVDLHGVTAVQELRTGDNPEFSVTCDGNVEKYRARNDQVRQLWINQFALHETRNTISAKIGRLTVAEKAKIYTENVYKPYTPPAPAPAQPAAPGSAQALALASAQAAGVPAGLMVANPKAAEFLFATEQGVPLDESSTTRTGPDGAAIAVYKPQKVFGIKERFNVLWPQTFTKDKPREIEIDLNRPHAIRFFKAKSSQPEVAFAQDEFLDFSFDEKNPKFEVDLSFMQKNNTKYQRKYSFSSAQSRGRFIELLVLFQKPETRAHHIHPDVLSLVRYFVPSTNKGLVQAGGPVAGGAAAAANGLNGVDAKAGAAMHAVSEDPSLYSLRQLFTLMHERAPSNIFVKELAEESEAISKDEKGEFLRLKLLVAKFFAQDFGGDIEKIACGCAGASRNCLLYLYKCFFACNGVPLVTGFVHKHHDEDAQLWAMRGIWQLRVLRANMTKCKSDPNTLLPGGKPFSAPIPIKDMDRPFAWYVDYLSSTRPVSEPVIGLLFEILTGNIQSSHAAKKVVKKYIAEREFLPVLCHACAKATTEAGLLALRTFTLLLKEPENCAIFLERRGWQNWIFPLLVDGTMQAAQAGGAAAPAAAAAQGAQRSFSTQKKDVEGDVFKLTITLFTTLHYEALCKKQPAAVEEQFNPVRDTLEFLFQFAGLNHETLALARVMLISTFIKLGLRYKDITAGVDYTHYGWHNFFLALSAAEDFCFFMPIREPNSNTTVVEEGLHYEPDGTVSDLPLVDKLVETILVFFPDAGKGEAYIDPKASSQERAIKRRGVLSYQFLNDVRLVWRKYNKITDNVERTVVMDELNSVLNRRVSASTGTNGVPGLVSWPDRQKLIRIRVPLAGSAPLAFSEDAKNMFRSMDIATSFVQGNARKETVIDPTRSGAASAVSAAPPGVPGQPRTATISGHVKGNSGGNKSPASPMGNGSGAYPAATRSPTPRESPPPSETKTKTPAPAPAPAPKVDLNSPPPMLSQAVAPPAWERAATGDSNNSGTPAGGSMQFDAASAASLAAASAAANGGGVASATPRSSAQQQGGPAYIFVPMTPTQAGSRANSNAFATADAAARATALAAGAPATISEAGDSPATPQTPNSAAAAAAAACAVPAVALDGSASVAIKVSPATDSSPPGSPSLQSAPPPPPGPPPATAQGPADGKPLPPPATAGATKAPPPLPPTPPAGGGAGGVAINRAKIAPRAPSLPPPPLPPAKKP